MVVTTTGIAFLLSSIGLAFCGIRFFGAFQRLDPSKSLSGVLLSAYYLATSTQHGILAISCFVFATNSEALYAIQVIVLFSDSLLAAFGVFLFFYILLPGYTRKPFVLIVLLFGLFVTYVGVVAHPAPILAANNTINWNNPLPLNILINLLLLISIGALLPIYLKNYFLAETKNSKKIFGGLVLLHFLGMVNVTILFLINYASLDYLRNRIFDIILMSIGLIFLTIFLLPVVTNKRLKS